MQHLRMTTTHTLTANRIHELDIIRGVALAGILIVNMGLFAFPAFYLNQFTAWPELSDKIVVLLINGLGEGKFISMFSFLFGLGFTIFMQRALLKAGHPVWLFSRRLLALLGIGLVHAYAIWYGDVLCIYSLLGFLLLFFRNSSPTTLLKWALALLLIPTILFIAGGLWIGPVFFQAPAQDTAAAAQDVIKIYRTGSLREIFMQNINDLAITRMGYLSIAPQIFAMFLLGAYAGKKGIFQRISEYLSMIKKVMVWSLLIGLPAALPAVLFANANPAGMAYNFAQFISSYIAGPAMGIFYICGVIHLLQKWRWRQCFTPFGAVGRMAATNYILQSVSCIFIFYSFGLGWYAQKGPAMGVAITVVLFACQLLVSNWWMARFHFGPVEWLWRTLTYGKVVPLRK